MARRNWIRVSTLAMVVTLWSAVAPPPAGAGLSVYVTGIGNEFGTLDLATGAFRQIATLNLPAGDLIYGIGFGADGKLYGVDSQPDANLWQINTSNGALNDRGAIGFSAFDATSDASGKLYVISQDAHAIYYTMNPPSPTPTVVGPTGITSEVLMAVNADGTELFTTTQRATSSTYDLVSLNPMTGMPTTLGSTGFIVDAGLFVGSTLYGFDTTRDAIVSLNTTTGAGTQVGTYYLPNGDPIFSAALPVPEPSSLVLGLIGTGLAVSVCLIRHHRLAAEPR
jgi:hypothetical protein